MNFRRTATSSGAVRAFVFTSTRLAWQLSMPLGTRRQRRKRRIDVERAWTAHGSFEVAFPSPSHTTWPLAELAALTHNGAGLSSVIVHCWDGAEDVWVETLMPSQRSRFLGRLNNSNWTRQVRMVDRRTLYVERLRDVDNLVVVASTKQEPSREIAWLPLRSFDLGSNAA